MLEGWQRDAQPAPGHPEDFAYFQQKVPGLLVFLGVTPRDQGATADRAKNDQSVAAAVNDPLVPGYVLCYPSRRQQPPALSALIETLRI